MSGKSLILHFPSRKLLCQDLYLKYSRRGWDACCVWLVFVAVNKASRIKIHLGTPLAISPIHTSSAVKFHWVSNWRWGQVHMCSCSITSFLCQSAVAIYASLLLAFTSSSSFLFLCFLRNRFLFWPLSLLFVFFYSLYFSVSVSPYVSVVIRPV